MDLRTLSTQEALDGASTRRIVVGFDDSPSAPFTQEWAAREAAARQSALDVLGPADSLLRAAVGAELMIIGASTPAAARRALFASVPPSARRSACPVVVLRGRHRDTMRRIVVGVDGSSAAEAALDWAIDEADRHGASVTVVHASPSYGAGDHARCGDDGRRRDARQVVEGAERYLEQRIAQPVRGEVCHGGASLVLVGVSGHADLLVIGSRGRSGFKTMLFGPAAIAVVEHAQCPVAVVHPRLRAP